MTDQLPDERPTRRREYSGALSTLGVAALVVVVVGFGLWFFQFRGSSPGGAGADSGQLGIISLPAALQGHAPPPAASVGRLAPDFKLSSLDGGTLTLDSLRGRYVVLNFWASWCTPCRVEAPSLQVLSDDAKQAHKPVVVLGVNQQETASAAASFTREFAINYPIVLDTSGQVSVAYHVDRGLPVTYLIDPSGRITHIYSGELTSTQLASLRRELLS